MPLGLSDRNNIITMNLCGKLLNNFLYLYFAMYPLDAGKIGGGVTFRQLKLHCLTHFWRLCMLPYVVFNAFWLILKWLFQNVQHIFCVFKMYNTGWAKSRRSLHCFFTIMVEISGRY